MVNQETTVKGGWLTAEIQSARFICVTLTHLVDSSQKRRFRGRTIRDSKNFGESVVARGVERAIVPVWLPWPRCAIGFPRYLATGQVD